MSLKRGLVILPLILLCVSVGANFRLLHFARQAYAEKLLCQVWPAGSTPLINVPPEAKGRRVLLLGDSGDSRIADWGLPRIKYCRIINAGAPGLTSAQLALQCRELLEKTRPEIVI